MASDNEILKEFHKLAEAIRNCDFHIEDLNSIESGLSFCADRIDELCYKMEHAP